MVRRGLAPSRTAARHLIDAGRVTVGGAPAVKPARLVADHEPVVVRGEPPRYVSRGGEKLHAALGRFGLDPTGLRILDAGASTGGFTDCLLQHGARQVVAVDVGHNQLHERLRSDPRVDNRERINVRDLEPDAIGGPVDMVVADLSFISLRQVVDALVACAREGADMVVLVKPQFEAGRAVVSRGRGVVRDPAVWRSVLIDVRDAFSTAKAAIIDTMASPITGADGNVEFLCLARTDPSGAAVAAAGRGADGTDAVIEAALAEAARLVGGGD